VKQYQTIVIGLNNGVIYIGTRYTDDEHMVWRSELGGHASWVPASLDRRPEDWQVLFDGEVVLNEGA
jgi:hypothetical protein